jgi:aminotransferase
MTTASANEAIPRTPSDLRDALMDLAATMSDVISLGLGDPDLATPPHVIAAAKEAMDGGDLGLTPPAGLPELRQAIAAKLRRENGIDVDGMSEVIVTTGGQEALFLIMAAIVNPGDEILVPDPRYSSYDDAIEMAGGRMVFVPTDEAHDFDLDPDEVEARITPRTRAILYISPSNPTAGMVSPANIRRIAQIARDHDLVVISDEIYEHYVYDDAKHLSIASLPGMKERTITVNGASKTFAMTGFRIGYVAAPAHVIDAMVRLKSVINVAAPTVSQWAVVAALNGPQACVEEMRQTYAARRAMLLAALDRMGFTYGAPRGALYVWANSASTGIPSTELSYRFLTEGRVLIFPGTGFGDQWFDYMRITLLQPIEILEEAARRMEGVIARYREGAG